MNCLNVVRSRAVRINLLTMADEELNFDELHQVLESVLPPAEEDSSFSPAEHLSSHTAENNSHSRKRSRKGDRSKKKEALKSKYVLDAAESTSGDESGGEDAEDGLDESILTQPRQEFLKPFENELSAEELGKEYERRERLMRSRKHRQIEGDDGAPLSSTREMSSIRYTPGKLPQPSDPKVFAVKCKPRMARVLVSRIVNKCYAYRTGRNLEKKVDLGIISVFSLDHVKEYIYIESHRQLFVTNALEGLVGVFRFNISQVQPAELMQMMEHKDSSERLHVGSIVRLRQRPYRGDLGQVVSLDHHARRAEVKVVPREDFVGKVFEKVKPSSQLPQRFFIPSLAAEAEDRGSYVQWGDLKFDKDGYLIKVVSLRSLEHGSRLTLPEPEELATFYNNNREKVKVAVARYTNEGVLQQKSLRIGDTVRVITGQLTNTIGTVVNILTSTSTAVLSCRPAHGKEPISVRVELSDCSKHFTEGTHIVVERGEHQGMSGTVVRSYGEVIDVFCDRSDITPEIRVKANDCYQSKLVNIQSRPRANHPESGSWSLYDLVSLTDSNTVGCVVLFHMDHIDVLTEQNVRRTVSYAQVKAVARGSRKTLDSFQNVLTRGAEVSIRRTDLTPLHLDGQSGRIEQVFNDYVFVSCNRLKENAGLVSLHSSCVLLAGGRTTFKSSSTVKTLPDPQRRPHNAEHANYPDELRSEAWEHESEYMEDSVGEQ